MVQARRLHLLILLCVAAWCGSFLAVPFLLNGTGPVCSAGKSLTLFFGTVCHQLPERSIMLDGQPIGVCERCMSIYLGFLAGAIVIGFLPRLAPSASRQAMIVALGPMLIDVLGAAAGMHQSSALLRILTGAWFGLGSSVILVPLAIRAMQEFMAERSVAAGRAGIGG